MVTVITALCALAVLIRVICMASHLNLHMWPGQKIRFTAFATALSGMGASAFGVAAGLPMAEHALLASIAGVLVFDRRRPREGTR
jgi:hypothetical protein